MPTWHKQHKIVVMHPFDPITPRKYKYSSKKHMGVTIPIKFMPSQISTIEFILDALNIWHTSDETNAPKI